MLAGILDISIDYLLSNENEPSTDPEAQISSLLLDSNRLEKKVLVETMRSLKAILYSSGI